MSNKGTYDAEGMSCYVNSSTSPTIQIYQCQPYNDHVHAQQIDNTFISNNHYGLFTFICGNGQIAVCPSGNCA